MGFAPSLEVGTAGPADTGPQGPLAQAAQVQAPPCLAGWEPLPIGRSCRERGSGTWVFAPAILPPGERTFSDR